MFAPSQLDVRRFFCETAAKLRAGVPLTPLEDLAAGLEPGEPEHDPALSGRRDEAAKTWAEAAKANPGNEVLTATIKRLQP